MLISSMKSVSLHSCVASVLYIMYRCVFHRLYLRRSHDTQCNSQNASGIDKTARREGERARVRVYGVMEAFHVIHYYI